MQMSFSDCINSLFVALPDVFGFSCLYSQFLSLVIDLLVLFKQKCIDVSTQTCLFSILLKGGSFDLSRHRHRLMLLIKQHYSEFCDVFFWHCWLKPKGTFKHQKPFSFWSSVSYFICDLGSICLLLLKVASDKSGLRKKWF